MRSLFFATTSNAVVTVPQHVGRHRNIHSSGAVVDRVASLPDMQTLAGQCCCNDFNVATRAAFVIVGKRRAYGLTREVDAIATKAHDLLATYPASAMSHCNRT